MTGENFPESHFGPTGPMYIVDLLEHIRLRNQTSLQEALSIIQVVRRYGPEVARAEMLDENSCKVSTHIGYGLDVVIELDRDRNGRWQPVVGQIVKR